MSKILNTQQMLYQLGKVQQEISQVFIDQICALVCIYAIIVHKGLSKEYFIVQDHLHMNDTQNMKFDKQSYQDNQILDDGYIYQSSQILQLLLIYFDQMSEIGLFGKEGQKPHSPAHSKSKEKRPPHISVSKIFSNNHKWKECKIIGKNISIRSYSAACSFQNKLYLYGGYQILHGSLDDFYSISLDQNEPTFIWEQIHSKGKCHPGKKSKHALLGGKQKIYLIGGLKANDEASNQIYEFDPSTSEWKLVKPQGVQFPPLESFSAVLINNGSEQKIIIAFGFNQKLASPSNAIYEYNIPKNKLTILYEGGSSKHDVPAPRIGSAITTDNQNIYIFGGKDENNRLNDLWSFSLSDYKFIRLKDQGEIPTIRNGHTMSYHDGQLYVFGGIHDITWELDDLHIYSLKNNKWTTLQQDSPRKVDKKSHQGDQQDKNFDQKSSGKKKNWYQTHNASIKQNNSTNPISPSKNFSLTYNEQAVNRNESPGKMLEEQRKKVFYQKKADMLSNFQISKEEKQKLLSLQTSSQAMKNSLDVIGTPDPRIKAQEDKLTQFGKQTISKFLEPLQNNSNIVIGKKPCARDGHCSVIIGDQLIIFGGDRHQMSFNDIYKLNLNLAIKEISH